MLYSTCSISTHISVHAEEYGNEVGTQHRRQTSNMWSIWIQFIERNDGKHSAN